MRNPLYHWTHLELSRIFGIDKVLNPSTAREIYDECTAKLQTPEFRAQAIMERMNVEVVCTTDDPIDDLKYHTQIRQSSLKTKEKARREAQKAKEAAAKAKRKR